MRSIRSAVTGFYASSIVGLPPCTLYSGRHTRNLLRFFFGPHELESATGVQQGDLSGPAIFALTLDSITRDIKCELNTWYLDDGLIGGTVESVVAGLAALKPALLDLGLDINTRKCAITFSDSCRDTVQATRQIREVLPGAHITSPDSLTHLGAPMTEEALANALRGKTRDLSLMCERLQELEPHASLFLLSKCLGIPKLLYLLRTSNTKDLAAAELTAFDDVMRESLTQILNTEFSSESWTQACLPIGMGGLRIRMLVDIALPSHLASIHSTLPLVSRILPQGHVAGYKESIRASLDSWGQHYPDAEIPECKELQREWGKVISLQRKEELLRDGDQFSRARILAAAAPRSGAWLQAVPSTSAGLLLDRESLRTAVSYRVGSDICIPHPCRCGGVVDRRGLHPLSCKFSAGRIPRHSAINDVVKRALSGCGIPTLLEPVGINRGDGRRPDGITLFPFHRGRCLVWDATVSDTFAPSHVLDCAVTAGAAAVAAGEHKRRKYRELAGTYQFEPLAFETSGVCGPSTTKVIAEIGRRLARERGEPRESSWLWQRLSIAIIRGNAACVLNPPRPP